MSTTVWAVQWLIMMFIMMMAMCLRLIQTILVHQTVGTGAATVPLPTSASRQKTIEKEETMKKKTQHFDKAAGSATYFSQLFWIKGSEVHEAQLGTPIKCEG